MLFVDSDMEQDQSSVDSGDMDTEDDDEEGTQNNGHDEDDGTSDGGDNDETTSEDGNDDPTEENGERKKKKRKRPNKKKEKISNSEAKELHDKEHTYSSNLYRIQIEELLKEVSIPEKRRTEVEQWFYNFNSFVMGCKSSKPHKITDVEQFLKGITLPLPNNIKPSDDANEVLTWTPPSQIKRIGSWESNSAVDKISSVDIAVELPLEYLRKKDFLNHRYHLKRAIYLSYLAKLLSKRGDDVKFTCQQGHPTKPVVFIECKQFSVKIITSLPEIFKINRFSLDINNVRFENLFRQALPEDEPEVATPNYNFTILSDILIPESDALIHKVIYGSQCFSNAVKLIKVWLKQRSLDKGFGGLTGFIASAFIVYLFSKGVISELMSTYDVLRIFFSNLSKLDLTTQGIGQSTGVSFKDWHLQFDVVFLDFNGVLNYTSDMSKFTYKRVQLEAQRAAVILENNKSTGFNTLFLTPVPFIQNFDHVLQFSGYEVTKLLETGNENKQQLLNYSGHQYPVAVSVLGQLIETCVGSRLQLIDHELIPEHQWHINEDVPNFSLNCLRFGFVINREATYKLVEKCDTEDPKRAEAFKEFWGSKSQLRRFKDGTMCETVVFESKNQILFQMLSYTFLKHLSVELEISSMRYIDCQIEDEMEKGFVMVKKLDKPRQTKFIKGKRKKPSQNDFQDLISREVDAISIIAVQEFDELSKILRSLEGLPLEVSTVQGTSPVLRFADVYPSPPQTFPKSKWFSQANSNNNRMMTFEQTDNSSPVLPKIPKLVKPVTVLLHLETSGKWPDDVAAVDRLKCAFLMRIGQLLNSQFGMVVHPHPSYLDVLKGGFIFRIKLTYYRELILLKQHLGADGVLKVRDSLESLQLEKETLLLPQLTTTLHSFHQEHIAFGKTCRLAKKWMASQLLLASPQCNKSDQPDCRFSEESIELLVSHIFMSYFPYLSPPNEAQVGFLRFLFLLSNCDWKVTPIVLNFHDKLTPKDVSAIELDFVKRRHQLPLMFIATPEDKMSSVWTRHLAPVLLYRAQHLAKEALDVLQTNLIRKALKEQDCVFKKQLRMIFRPDFHEFDVIIRLKKSMNSRYCESVEAANTLQYYEYTKSSDELIPIVDFDPVQIYLLELQCTFGHLAIFLHDTFGGQFIAVVWKPNAFKEHNFVVSAVNTGRLLENRKIAAHMEEVLESLELMGNGLVDSIEINKDPLST